MTSFEVLSAAYREAAPGRSVPLHRNASLQWYVVAYGEVEITIEGQTRTLRGGESVLVWPDASRSLVAQSIAGYAWMLLRADHLDFHSLYGAIVPVPDELQFDLRALFEELRHPAGSDTVELTRALAARLLIALKRSARRQLPPGEIGNVGAQQEIVAKLDAYMRHHLHEVVTRRKLAEVACLSSPHVARVFRAATGQSLHQHLTELRLQRARQLLQGSTMSITQIAHEVGFSSFSHFSSTFKRAVGLSPSHYRRTGGRLPPGT